MNRKILALITAASFALFFGACGEDKGNTNFIAITCLDTDDCLDENEKSSHSVDQSSSSENENDDSSSSEETSSSEDSATSSSNETTSSDDANSSDSATSSEAAASSSSSATQDSSSSEAPVSSSSEVPVSSSSEAPASSSNEAPASSSVAASSSNAKESSSSIAASSSSAKASSSSIAPSSSSVKFSSSSIAVSSSSETFSSSSVPKTIKYANTTPNLADLEVSGDTLFAIFQRQNSDYTISHNGLLAMFDLESGDLLDTIQLSTKNPIAVKIVNGFAYVATAGTYNASYALSADNNRGLEKVDIKQKTSTLMTTGTKLGGGINDFVVDAKNGKGYALVYKSNSVTPKIVEINLATGSITKTIGSNDLYDPEGGLDFDEENGILYIGERYMNWKTYEMSINVFAYNGSTLSYISDADPEYEEYRMPYSIKTINGTPYVFVSDYNSGALYLNYENSSSTGISFYQDSKLAVVDNNLYVMVREASSASIAKINLSQKKVEWQTTTVGKNPYDMVSAGSNLAWVAYYGSPYLELFNTSTRSTVKMIDTKAFCAVKVD